MLLSTVSPGTSPIQDLQPDAAQASPGASGNGTDSFASRLTQALEQFPKGQEIAAGAEALTSLPLGRSMELITTDAGQPDRESLAAFATAQGLDPEVVAWLLGDAPHTGESDKSGLEGKSAKVAAEAPADGLDTALQAGMLLPQGVLLPVPLQGQAHAAAPSIRGLGLPLQTELAAASLSAAGAGPQTETQLQVQALAGEVAPDPLLATAAQLGGANWLERVGEGLAAQADAAPLTTTTPSLHAAAQALASAGMPAQVLGKPEINTKVDIGSRTFGMHVEVLSLEADPFTLSLLEQADQPVAEQTGASADAATTNGQPFLGTGTGVAGAADQAASSDPASETAQARAAQHRAEALHTLAQRLGEAVGQRVLGQIARGNWSMKLVLKPATLGDVEVDLRMRAGELDAAFRTMNPMTRELLNDGLSRLRDVLTSAGMDVAGLQVGHGSSQSAGGNPTPRQPMAGESQGIASTDARKGAEAVAPAGAVGARRAGSANWDVLV